MKLRPLQTQEMVQEAANAILDKIVEERLKPGDFLPSQAQLSAQLGIGRSSIREAVQRLVVLGVIKVKQGRRMQVGNALRQRQPSSLAELEESLRHQTSKDLAELHSLLEPELAALAAQRAEPGQIDKLESILADMRLPGNESKIPDLHRAFHRTLAQCSQNKAAERLLAALEDSSTPAYQPFDDASEQQRFACHVADQHQAILQALKDRDPAVIRAFMQQHVQHS